MSYYIDLFDPSGFTYSTEENDRNLNRTLRFEEGVTIPIPNWVPKLIDPDFWPLYNSAESSLNPPFVRAQAVALLNVEPYSGFMFGYNQNNYGSMVLEDEIAVSLYVDPDNPSAGLQPSSLQPVYGPARSYAIPSITIPGHLEVSLPYIGIIDSTSAHNYLSLWYEVGSHPDVQYFQDDEYKSYGIALYPPINTAVPKDIGVERDKDNGEILGVIQGGLLSFPPPMPVQSVNAFTFSFLTGVPATINVESTDYTFIGLDLVDITTIEEGIASGYPLVIDSAINSNYILAQYHGISTSEFTGDVFVSTNRFIAQSTIDVTQAIAICNRTGIKYPTIIIDSELSAPFCTIERNAHLKRNTLEIEKFLYIDNIASMRDCEININSTEGDMWEITNPVIRFSTLFSEYEETIDDQGDTVTEYVDQYTKTTGVRFAIWPEERQFSYLSDLSKHYDLVLNASNECVNSTIQAGEALVSGTLTDCSLLISNKLTIDDSLTLVRGTHDIRMFEIDSYVPNSSARNNGRLYIFGATVDLYSDKLLEIDDKEFVACTTGDQRFANCVHYLDIENNGILNISSANPLVLDTNNGVINVTNGLSVTTNDGTINGGSVSCSTNYGTIATADAYVSYNYGSLLGRECTVDLQYLNGSIPPDPPDKDITANLTIQTMNLGGENLSINATFVGAAINAGSVNNATFADKSVNDGNITGSVFFVDESTNKSNLFDISVSLSNNASSIGSYIQRGRGLVSVSINLCDLNISQDAVCGSSIGGCNVSMSRGNIANASTNGCIMQLQSARVVSDVFSNNIVEADGCSITSNDPGGGNTITLNNRSTLGGEFYNYSLPTNPKGDCPGPPNPYANPDECTPELGCNGCWYNGCWNRPDPANNGGSITFNNSVNAADINPLNGQSYEDGCISTNSWDPNVGYSVVKGANALVPVIFNQNSRNIGQVNKAIFNRECWNVGIAINSIFNAGSRDSPLDGTTGGNNIYNAGSIFNGISINGGIVNGATIYTQGGTIRSMLGGSVYLSEPGGGQQPVENLLVQQMDAGTIFMTSNRKANLSLGRVGDVTIDCSGGGTFEISVVEGSSVTITGSGGIIYLEVHGVVDTLNLNGNVVLKMNGGFSYNINNNKVLWNLRGWGFVNNNGVLYTGLGMGKTSGGGVKICLHHMSPSASIPVTYGVDDPDCAVQACVWTHGWVCCSDIRGAIAARFPDPEDPTQIAPRYKVAVPEEFLFDYYGNTKRLCI